MAKFELRNGRMINHTAYHDLFKNDVEILHEKFYTECYDFVLKNGDDNDWYSEPHAVPNYKGETVASLRKTQKERVW